MNRICSEAANRPRVLRCDNRSIEKYARSLSRGKGGYGRSPEGLKRLTSFTQTREVWKLRTEVEIGSDNFCKRKCNGGGDIDLRNGIGSSEPPPHAEFS